MNHESNPQDQPEVPPIPDTADELVSRIDESKAETVENLGEAAMGDLAAEPNSETSPNENPRNHLELAGSRGVDMSEIRESILQSQLRNQREVFGEKELAAVEGREASKEAVQAVVNAIETLTQEKALKQEEFNFSGVRKLQRRLDSRDEAGRLTKEAWLNYYPDGASSAHPNVSGRALVDLQFLHEGKKYIPGYGDARTTDDMYVSQESGKPMIVRKVDISRWNTPNHILSAEREATEEEVQEALSLITEMVKEEEQRKAQSAEAHPAL